MHVYLSYVSTYLSIGQNAISRVEKVASSLGEFLHGRSRTVDVLARLVLIYKLNSWIKKRIESHARGSRGCALVFSDNRALWIPHCEACINTERERDRKGVEQPNGGLGEHAKRDERKEKERENAGGEGKKKENE